MTGPGSGVTAPAGFRAAGVTAGLKTAGSRDLALVVNDGPRFAAAGVFTRNRVKAAPVRWSEQVLRGGEVRAVLLNSGCANACTGPAGFQDVHACAERVAAELGASGVAEVGAAQVAVCSTGLIGQRLDLPKVLTGITTAVAELSPTGGAAAAEAIMTTDTRPKTATVSGDGWRVGGMAKGAGMLAPELATMLSVITTDAVADAELLARVLRQAVRVSFERVDSDGCLSTNDTVLLLASGASGVTVDEETLTGAVTGVCTDLARQLIADAEGATKQVAIEVTRAASEADAVEVARAVARSNLVKTALFGNDPNWGRILAAVGTTGAAFDPDALDVAVNGVWVARGGAAAAPRESADLSGAEVRIEIVLHAGEKRATVWTNDLSHGYVHENSAYST